MRIMSGTNSVVNVESGLGANPGTNSGHNAKSSSLTTESVNVVHRACDLMAAKALKAAFSATSDR